MFDMVKIGRGISRLRKARDMTQMDLADALGVSYQAVSNWERGNSMPDVSRLPALAQALGATVDELLGDEQTVRTVKKALDESKPPLTPEEFTQLAPALKPSQAEEAARQVAKEALTLTDLIALAPFLSEATLAALARRIAKEKGIKALLPLMPFLPDDVLEGFCGL